METICGTLINEKSHGHHKQRMLNQSWRNSASKLRNPGMKSNLAIVLSGLGRKVMVGLYWVIGVHAILTYLEQWVQLFVSSLFNGLSEGQSKVPTPIIW